MDCPSAEPCNYDPCPLLQSVEVSHFPCQRKSQGGTYLWDFECPAADSCRANPCNPDEPCATLYLDARLAVLAPFTPECGVHGICPAPNRTCDGTPDYACTEDSECGEGGECCFDGCESYCGAPFACPAYDLIAEPEGCVYKSVEDVDGCEKPLLYCSQGSCGPEACEGPCGRCTYETPESEAICFRLLPLHQTPSVKHKLGIVQRTQSASS